MADNNESENKTSKMPSDFWQMVQKQRASAQALIEARKKRIYQTFVTKEVEEGSRIPMPKGFWQAITGNIEVEIPSPEEVMFHKEEAVENTSNLPEKENKSPIKENNKHVWSPEEKEIFKKWEENPQIEEPANSEAIDENSDIVYLEQISAGKSFKEAAFEILSREKRPMTAREIATIAINEGLVISVGKTPDASVAGQIGTDIKRNPEKTPFVVTGPRTYALKSFISDEMEERDFSESLEIVNITQPIDKATNTVISGVVFNQKAQATKPILTESNKTDEVNYQIINLDELGIDIKLASDLDETLEIDENSLLGRKQIQKISASPIESSKESKAIFEDLEELSSSEQENSENKKMSYKQAAIYLLERMRRPMTAREIVTIALEEGLIDSNSKKPDSSLAGQIYTEIQKIGERSLFKQIAPRTYALAEWYKKNE
jgi:hypothetical protein